MDSSSGIDWKQADPYYWTGPDGWGICKVILDGSDHFELWREKKCHARTKTLKAAQKAHLTHSAQTE